GPIGSAGKTDVDLKAAIKSYLDTPTNVIDYENESLIYELANFPNITSIDATAPGFILDAAIKDRYRQAVSLKDKIDALNAEIPSGPIGSAGKTDVDLKAAIKSYLDKEDEVDKYDLFIAKLVDSAEIEGVTTAGTDGDAAQLAIRKIAISDDYRSKTSLKDKIDVILNHSSLVNDAKIRRTDNSGDTAATGKEVKAAINNFLNNISEVDKYDLFISKLVATKAVKNYENGSVLTVSVLAEEIRKIAISDDYRSKTSLKDKIDVILNAPDIKGSDGYAQVIADNLDNIYATVVDPLDLYRNDNDIEAKNPANVSVLIKTIDNLKDPAGAPSDNSTQVQDAERVNAWLKKRDEFVAANPTDKPDILTELALDNMRQLDYENFNPEDFL
ncbi:1075_t:CDS:2, partial [Ambispora leptoticha]